MPAPRQAIIDVEFFLRELSKMTDDGKNLRRLVDDPETAQNFLRWLEDLGKRLVEKKVKTAQIRKSLERIRRIYLGMLKGKKRDQEIVAEVKMLATIFAYDAGRHPEQLKELYQIIRWVIDRVKTPEDFIVLKQLMEGIVAFHRFYGGRE